MEGMAKYLSVGEIDAQDDRLAGTNCVPVKVPAYDR